MTIAQVRHTLAQVFAQEELNFLVTNRIPRRFVTQLVGWFSQIEHPIVRDLSLWTWQMFADLELEDAARTEFTSMHDCFTRELREGARPVDPATDIVVSPCDGIVGASGRIDLVKVIHANGFPYSLQDLLHDPELVERYRDGRYVTLRLNSSMYHRFHAPHDLKVEHVTYVSGDTWNTNPIALKRVERLYCKNERAIIRCQLEPSGVRLTLVPVAAILVASIKLHFLDVLLHLRHRGPNEIPCSAHYKKGQEMGFFQHGSTIIVFGPKGTELCDNVRQGETVRMGQPLLRLVS